MTQHIAPGGTATPPRAPQQPAGLPGSGDGQPAPAGPLAASPAPVSAPAPSPNRSGPVPGPVGVPQSPPRPRNTLWIIVGLLLMTLAGLAALGLAGGLAARVEVLVAAQPIAQGQVVTAEDFTVAQLSVSTEVEAISPRQLDDYVGRVAVGPIGAGAVLHPGQFAESVDGGVEHVIVGAALQPGAYPRVGLRPGDRVRLVDIEAAVGSRVPTEAEVVEVVPTGSGGELLISLRIDETQAEPVAGIAARGALRLALVDEGFDDLVTPLEPVLPVTPLEPAELVEPVPAEVDAGAEPGETDAFDESVEPDTPAEQEEVAE